MPRLGRRALIALAGVLATVGTAGGITVAQANHAGDEVTGHTTTQITICPNEALCPTDDFTFLRAGPGEPHLVRGDLAPAGSARASRRRSLAYFAQISDFQLADEESPARVEAVDDEPSGTASSAWRPQEAMVPHEADRTIRQVNRFLKSTIRQGNGARASMLNAVLTGDFADSQQATRPRGWCGCSRAAPRPVERDEGPQRPWMPARRSGRGRLRQPQSLHGRPGLRRLPTGQRQGPQLLRPQRAAVLRRRHLAPVPGPDEPRPGAVHVRMTEGPLVRRVRQSRQPGPGQRGRRPLLRGHSDGLREAAVARERAGHDRAQRERLPRRSAAVRRRDEARRRARARTTGRRRGPGPRPSGRSCPATSGASTWTRFSRRPSTAPAARLTRTASATSTPRSCGPHAAPPPITTSRPSGHPPRDRRHGVRGRPDPAVVRGEHRRPAVQVAEPDARRRLSPRRADLHLQPPRAELEPRCQRGRREPEPRPPLPQRRAAVLGDGSPRSRNEPRL